MSSAVTANPPYRNAPGVLHTILLAGSVSLFLGALLSDVAYYNTQQIQWSNFASWLIAGAMVFCGLALVFALVNLVRAKRKAGHPLSYFLALLLTFVLGLVNAFTHAKDAWAAMPAGLILSVIVFVLILVSAWLGLGPRSGGAA
ncbi:DUF2231 domain-containing protein [Massilia yuzhufengensis]|uniref:Uncharacterized membrane protein n=1 Tax=Massilia yuzhufengensis TaxID=1164594 RepID=A0A1I1NCJ1_9BURK|nr:DUF2231 domain-containing protein [Massilia yuzhufengensis]SFC95076.1 Uncharacterized membrane protein [Massilia yuzhufengensis]